MTRAEYAAFNLFFINAANGEGLITGQRHRNMNDVQRQYIDESLPFQTTVLFTSVGGDTWYFQDSRLTGKVVIRVTGRTFVKIASDLEAIAGSPDSWKFNDGSTFEGGEAIVVDFYEP